MTVPCWMQPGRLPRARAGLVLLVVLGLSPPATRAGAQTQPSTRPSTHASLDLALGPATSWGGAHQYRGRATGSWTLTFVPVNRGSRIVAITVGRRPEVIDDLVCVFESDGGCAPQFPAMTDLGIGIGLEAGAPAARVRAALGPTLYLGGLRAGGARLQVDAAGGFRHVQLVIAGRGDLVRRGAENLRLGSLEIGVRLID